MKKLLLIFLLIPGLALGQSLCRNDAQTTQYATEGQCGQMVAGDQYGNQYVVQVGGGGSGLSQSVVPTSNSVGYNGTASVPIGYNIWEGITDTTEAGSTTTVLNLTSHSGRIGDAVMMRAAGANIGVQIPICDVTANTVTLCSPLPVTPGTDAIAIVRPLAPSVNWNRTLSTTGETAMSVSMNYQTQPNPGQGLIKQEDLAHGTGDAGVASLFVYESAITASAATNDYGNPKADTGGRTIVTDAPAGETWQGCGTATASTSDVAIKAGVASNRIYVTSVTCSSSDADNATNINFKDGSTVIAVGGVNQMATTSAGTFAATFPTPLRGTVNTALNFNTAVSTSSVICCAAGYISTI